MKLSIKNWRKTMSYENVKVVKIINGDTVIGIYDEENKNSTKWQLSRQYLQEAVCR